MVMILTENCTKVKNASSISFIFRIKDVSLIRNQRDTGHHFTEELLAQAMCQAEATKYNLNGRVYAVGRQCPNPWPRQNDNCKSICESPQLHVQDSQTAKDKWNCIGAYHVYYHRPPTMKHGQRNNARLGLKSKEEDCTEERCGPNYCCCYAAYE